MSWDYRLRRQLVFLRHLFWEAYRERLLLSIVATVVFGTLIAMLNGLYSGLGTWDHYTTLRDISESFCEPTDMGRLIRQPVNAFTNIVYLVAAMFCFSKGMEDIKKKRSHNLITANRFYSFVLSGILLYTFVCSSLYHSSLIEFYSKMDFSAVYSVTLFPAMYFAHRALLRLNSQPSNVRRPRERYILIAIFSILYVILTFNLNMEVVHVVVTLIIAGIIAAGIYLERKDPGQTNKDYLIATIVSISIAGILFEMDIQKLFCGVMGRVSPHCLWHIFNGFSIFFFYLYIRSERYDHARDQFRIDLRKKVDLKIKKVRYTEPSI